ncbi:MAG: UvrD-helicase domain-containing protein [Candidatus Marinimicrobia bacterium]|nr:UvrD-helicase domain-containing protein [Candidatus Neomarinimicrobiota bacterium]
MKLITDFHIHSHFSLATSKQLSPEYLDLWCKLKGINVVATGDFTHPGWIRELKEKVEPAEEGLFRLKPDIKLKTPVLRFNSDDFPVRFILSAEISSIYKKNGKVRKVHSVVLAPDFETVEKIQQKLVNIGGNITSDGRPILGLDAKDLLEICLDISDDIYFIPAHIWTPWFSVLGAKSGFDSINECFEDLTPYISAVETGLSTNSPMNWMCSFLDRYTLISNSDAHSPEKLGRNANMMNCDLTYTGIVESMKFGENFIGTIDMYPQEGKYHYDGHRKCGICLNPVETLEHDGLCPKCGKKLTVGVMNRIVQLSDRENIEERPNRKPFFSIIPLKEIIAEINNVSPASKTVGRRYYDVISNLGNELDILLFHSLEEIHQKEGYLLAEAISRMRHNKVLIQEGFDGEYGKIRVFTEKELTGNKNNSQLFPEEIQEEKVIYKSQNLLNFSLEKFHDLYRQTRTECPDIQVPVYHSLNTEQVEAVETTGKNCIVMAGPGTGKTRTLVYRIAHLIEKCNISPGRILVVTFTNKAASEIRDRIGSIIPTQQKLQVFTFHGLGFEILKKSLKDFLILDEDEVKYILQHKMKLDKKVIQSTRNWISGFKQNFNRLAEFEDSIFSRYQQYLKENNYIDMDDLVYEALNKLSENPDLFKEFQFDHFLIDEYQDINESQFRLLKKLSEGRTIFAIGDANQSIYGFRGASRKYIENFQDHFPDSQRISFSTSYRCTNNILRASADVIAGKTSLNGLKNGVKITIHEAESDKSEAEYIARKIEDITGGLRFFSLDSEVADGQEQGDIALNQIVVLCRTKAMMPVLVKAFTDHAIPMQVVDNQPFYNEKPMKSMINLLKIFINSEHQYLVEEKNDFTGFMPGPGKTRTKEILEALIYHFFQKDIEKYEKDIQRLLDFADQWKDPAEFLHRLAQGPNEDIYSHQMQNVKIMTLHAAKGLEFDHVFIAGCENRLLPFSLYKYMESDIEEERRLFYVGMTRSKKYLYLTHAKKRKIRGMTYTLSISPFLKNIKQELLKQEKSKYKKKINRDNQLELF